MPKPKHKRNYSPTLIANITPDQYETAKRSHSGACLIADAIKRDYPHFTKVTADMAALRVTDVNRGVQLLYLMPAIGQHCLLSWDQGWPNPTDRVTFKGAVKITPIRRPKTGPRSVVGVAESRRERIAALETKEQSGESLTTGEKISLTQLRQNEAKPPPPERPSSEGRAEVLGEYRSRPVVVGGRRIPTGQANPNLLRGRDRHFGAKLSDPGLAFREAVDQAVAERLAQEKESS